MKIILLFLTLAATALAQTVPTGMAYQVRLTDTSNAPAPDGNSYEIDARLWNSATGGTQPIWAARYSNVSVKNGAFNLMLGSPGGEAINGAISDLKTVFNTTPTTYIALTVNKSATGASVTNPFEILPRQQLLSSPYAFRAEVAAATDPNAILSASIKDGEVKTADIGAGEVNTANLADAAVTAAKLAAGSVTPSAIVGTGIPFSLINQDFAYFVDEKPQGTAGGSATSQQRRTLNKTVLSVGTSITRSGDIITLAPGTYWIEASAPGYNIEHTAALVDTTTSNIVLAGRYARSVETATSEIRGPLVVTGTPLSFEIRDYGFSFGSGASLGNPAKIAAPEKHTEISITRIK